ncbi:MAG: hypothetical protein OEZ38_09610 [Gammaproteobacteria bacterium]|nr:hypothetical protein [Gammaproteobacteria bacterium]
MYHAELARILGVQCADIGEMASVKKFIEINTPAWQQACLLVRFYNRLYEKYSGDEVSMCHWLRRYNNEFSDSPFYLIVDKNRLLDVTCFLESDTK